MPDWPIHLIVPLLALLMVSRKEHQKYVLLLLPLAVAPDLDTFMTQHRALLHNMFLPLILLLSAWVMKEKRTIFIIAAVYLASHVFMDMFGGGVVIFYPFYDRMAFVDASLQTSQANDLLFTFDYGFKEYDAGWMKAYGYIMESTGTGAMIFVILAGVCVRYRNWIKEH